MRGLSRVRFPGPLKPFAAEFATELSSLGYTDKSGLVQLRLMAHVSRWLEAESVDAGELSPAQAERYLKFRRAAGRTSHLTERAMQPMLTYLRRIGVAPEPSVVAPSGPVAAWLERYRHYLTVERGLGGPTARGYLDAIRPFLVGRLSHDGLSLELDQLTTADVRAFVVLRCAVQSRSPAKLTVTALRSLLGFLHVEGNINRPLAEAVPSVAGWRLAGLPKGLEPQDVQRLLMSCDRRKRQGRRDFAILTLLVRLGLRAGEVAVLSLDDIDWQAGTLEVHGKGNRVETMPLPADVGEAVAAYLRRGRPLNALARTVFVRLKAPLRALSSVGVTQVVAAAAERAGLEQIYAHRLRHTAATQMLRAGALLPEISQVLRHRRLLSTAIYAKVDRDGLRTIARRWPRGVK